MGKGGCCPRARTRNDGWLEADCDYGWRKDWQAASFVRAGRECRVGCDDHDLCRRQIWLAGEHNAYPQLRSSWHDVCQRKWLASVDGSEHCGRMDFHIACGRSAFRNALLPFPQLVLDRFPLLRALGIFLEGCRVKDVLSRLKSASSPPMNLSSGPSVCRALPSLRKAAPHHERRPQAAMVSLAGKGYAA